MPNELLRKCAKETKSDDAQSRREIKNNNVNKTRDGKTRKIN